MFLNIVVTGIIVFMGILYNRKGSVKIWLSILALLIIANIGTYFAQAHLKNKTKAFSENTHKVSLKTFLASLKKNPAVVRAIYTEQGYLAIIVVNDGKDKTSMATYYCDLAKSEDIYLSGVKILDAADTKFGKSYAYGTELADASCH